MNHRATYPCGIFTGAPFSVLAKLDTSPEGEDQFAAELSGFSLIRSRTAVATAVPVAGGIVRRRRGTRPGGQATCSAAFSLGGTTLAVTETHGFSYLRDVMRNRR